MLHSDWLNDHITNISRAILKNIKSHYLGEFYRRGPNFWHVKITNWGLTEFIH